jgi:hypothetical protein
MLQRYQKSLSVEQLFSKISKKILRLRHVCRAKCKHLRPPKKNCAKMKKNLHVSKKTFSFAVL